MRTEIHEFSSFSDQMNKFGYKMPPGFAFLPLNFETAASKEELVYSSEVKSIRKLLIQNQIIIDKIENGNERQLFLHQHDASWLAPTIFIGLSFISENPNALSIALNVLSNYLTDFFKGNVQKKGFKLDIVIEVEKNKSFTKLTIEGEPADFSGLVDLIKELKR